MTARRDHGEGSVYQRADGRWFGSVTLPSHGGARRRKVVSGKTKDVVVAKLRLLKRELNRAGDLPTSSPTLDQWATRWLTDTAAKRLKPRTLDSYRGVVVRYIIPAIGKVRLDKLTPTHVRQMHTYVIGKGLSTTTALQAHRVLAKCLTDAERDGLVTRNVAGLTDAPPRAVVERDSLTSDQAVTLLRSVAADEFAAVRWSLALFAGMRQGECLGLRREYVDLEAGTITVAWQIQHLTWKHGCTKAHPCGRKRGGDCPLRTMRIADGQEAAQAHGNLWYLRPKSRKSWRRIPMAPPLWEIMRRHCADLAPDELVFTTADGLPVHPSDDSKAWHAALDAAGLPSMPLHSARHTAASLLFGLGVPEQTRMDILGHASATTTAGYTHDRDLTMSREAMAQYGRLLGPAAEPGK